MEWVDVYVEVVDSGSGIPPEQQARVLEPFAQVLPQNHPPNPLPFSYPE